MYPCELITSEQSLRKVISEKSCLILKHSTRCPISTAALTAFTKYLEKNPSTIAYIILVVENRAESLLLAEIVNVKHESPQAFLISDGKPLWNVSHRAITVENLTKATELAA